MFYPTRFGQGLSSSNTVRKLNQGRYTVRKAKGNGYNIIDKNAITDDYDGVIAHRTEEFAAIAFAEHKNTNAGVGA